MATGSSARPENAGSRGPVGRKPVLSPTGYRVSDRRRFELRMAGSYMGKESLQDIIDLAVTQFLDRLRDDDPEFERSVNSAERHRQRQAGVRSLGEAAQSKMRKS